MLNEQGVERSNGFVGIAADLVHCEPKYRDIVKDLLGRTVIAEDMDSAIAIANRFGHRFRIVTLDGQIINAGGSMTGGSVSRNAGILSRANEIERLRSKEKELAASYETLKTSYAEALRQTNEVAYELLSLEGKLRTAQDEVLRLEGEEKQYVVLEEAIGDAISSAEKELSSLNERITLDGNRGKTLETEILELDRKLQGTEQDLKLVSDGQSVAAEESNRLSERMTKLRMDIAALEAEKTTAQESVASLRGLEQAMRGDRQQRLALIQTYGDEESALQGRIKEENDRLTRQEEDTEGLRKKLAEDLAERQRVEARKTSLEKDIQNKNKDIQNVERECARLESKKTSAEMEEKQIIDKLWDSYQLTRSTAPEAAVEMESVMAAQKRTAELKRKINALGHPNIGAIDEYARVNERYEYLTGQRDDVLTSKKDLEGIIADITAQMTDIFSTEFAKINH
jgi:chromosome segregation protein